MNVAYALIKRKYSDANGSISKECFEIIIGIPKDGHRQILGFETFTNEESNTWEIS